MSGHVACGHPSTLRMTVELRDQIHDAARRPWAGDRLRGWFERPHPAGDRWASLRSRRHGDHQGTSSSIGSVSIGLGASRGLVALVGHGQSPDKIHRSIVGGHRHVVGRPSHDLTPNRLFEPSRLERGNTDVRSCVNGQACETLRIGWSPRLMLGCSGPRCARIQQSVPHRGTARLRSTHRQNPPC